MVSYTKLEEVCDVIDPHPSHRAPKVVSDGIPFVGIGDFDQSGNLVTSKARRVDPTIYDEHRKRYLLQDDLLAIGRVASIGKVVQLLELDELYTISPTLAVLKPHNINRQYLFYALQCPEYQKQLIQLSSGSTRRSVGMKNLRITLIPFVSRKQQKRIVAILDEAFAGIDQAIANTEKNLASAREIFESYLNEVFTRKGEGWEEKTLGEVCVLQRGFDLPRRLRKEGHIPLVSSSGVIDYVCESKVLGPGVATGRSGSIGNVFFIKEDFWPLNTVLYIKEFYENDPELIYYLLKKFDLKKYSGGAGVPTLNRNHVHSEMINIPIENQTQKEVVAKLNCIKGEIVNLEFIHQNKLTSLKELKQSLLQKAFSGELTADMTANVEAAE